MLYKTPQQRHRWGEHQPAFHPWMGDIMLDLIVVGVCYMLGDVIKYSFYKCSAYDTYSNTTASYTGYDEAMSGGYPSYDGGGGGDEDAHASPYCVGLSEGLLHAAAFYLCIFRLWSCGMMYRARFCADGSVAHLTLDVASGLLVVLASHGVRPPVDLRAVERSTTCSRRRRATRRPASCCCSSLRCRRSGTRGRSQEGPSWWSRSWPPRSPQAASEGPGPPS